MLSAEELHRRGLTASNAGRHAAARSLFQRALGRVDSPETRAKVMLSLAHVEAELGRGPDGVRLCHDALGTPELSDPVRGRVHAQLGLLHTRSGRGTEALAEFTQALPLLVGQTEDLALVHLNRGMLHLQQGDVAAAARDFEAAASRAEEAGAAVTAAKAEHNFGYARMLAGDLVTALRLMDKVRPVLASLSPAYEAVCEQDRAETLTASGMTRDAATALEDAAKAFGVRGLRQRQAEAELALARLLLQQDPESAQRVARRAARRFRARGSDPWALRADAVAYRGAVAAGKRTDPAGQRALAAALQAQGLSNDAAMVTLTSVLAALQRDEPDKAATALVATRIPGRAPLPTRLLDREVRAKVAAAQGNPRGAMAHVRRGLADLHEWQSSFGSLELQSSLVGHGRGLALHGLALAVRDGRPEVVFEWSERARALVGRVPPVRPPSDPEVADCLTELRRISTSDGAKDGDPGGAGRRQRSAELRDRIRQRRWYGAGSGQVNEPATLGDLLQHLSARGGVLVSYVVVDGGIHALVADADGAQLRDLGRFEPVGALLAGMQADLDMAASRLTGDLAQVVRAGLDARLSALAERLVAPLADLIGSERLAVVPSGSLAGLPWTLLPDLTQRPLTVCSSASSWLDSVAPAATARGAGFVAGPGVERAYEEITQAARAWDRALVLGPTEAVAGRVGSVAASVDVFHLAAHGLHSADNPLFSGLQLTDGFWCGYDIDQLPSIPSTVVLSACELGRSAILWGEETLGMTAAWLHAGARCVVASPARVADETACALLTATHAELARGRPPAVALAEATATLPAGVRAPFICFGSGW